MPGFGVSASVMKNFIVSNLYVSAEYTYLAGKTDYVGGYNPSAGNPHGTPYGSLKAKGNFNRKRL